MSEPTLCVVGAGVAGLCTAIAAAPRPVLLLSRGGHALDCASALAQGGLAAAVGEGDDPQQHAEDTLNAGAARGDPEAVARLTAEAPQAVVWLEQLGVGFDRDADGYQLAREGGHRCARVLHIGGDATGRELTTSLARIARQAPHIDWRQGCDVESLGLRRGRVAALRWRDRQGLHEQPCAALVLAGGSLVASFADSTHPAGSDGAALCLALDAGARGRDLHYIQFHPTALHGPRRADGRLALVTEALRGAGAELRDQQGRRFMADLHPLAELAPRDICARGVWQAQARDGWVWLHAEHLRLDWRRQFPGVLETCLAQGIDPRQQPIPVGIAAHYQVGGIACDALGQTSVEGLYAAGEIASSGVHGGNRLASNSLLEAVAAGRRLGHHLAALPRPRSGDAERWVQRGAGSSPGELATLRQLTQRCLGPLREAEELHRALLLTGPQGPLGEAWQARLLSRLLNSALADPLACGVHHWRPGGAPQSQPAPSQAVA